MGPDIVNVFLSSSTEMKADGESMKASPRSSVHNLGLLRDFAEVRTETPTPECFQNQLGYWSWTSTSSPVVRSDKSQPLSFNGIKKKN